MTRPLLLLSLLTLSSCHLKSDQNNENIVIPETSGTTVVTDQHTPKEVAAEPDDQTPDTLKINYQKNKEILDILPLLPDSAIGTWVWPQSERQNLVNSIKTNNYYVHTTGNVKKILTIKPHHLSIQPFDGYFIVSSYKISNGNYIIITNNATGDGKEINAYELANQQLVSLNLEELLGPYQDYFSIDPDNQKCKALVEDAEPYNSIDFDMHNKVEITTAIDKKEADNCLKGNSVILVFNRRTKKFDVEAYKWKTISRLD